jgi:predicted nucleotidyltransferase
MVKTVQNESKMLGFLTRHFTEKYSINQLAKRIKMTPKGAHKLLKKLEQEGIVIPLKLGNAVFYSLNLDSDLALKKAELSLFEEISSPYARAQAKDLERLRPCVLSAVLFGSVLENGEKAGDIDVLLVFEKKNYKTVQRELDKLQALKTKRIHAVLQMPQDLVSNLRKNDKVVLEILRTGKVLWGHDVIVNAIKGARHDAR